MGSIIWRENKFGRREDMKEFHDNIHVNILVDPLALKFIDTEEFQRLRDIKQLGLCDRVFMGATHTRFEHCLGVYWLSNRALRILNDIDGDSIDSSDVTCVTLAGLLHDLGHGPFSHALDNEFLPRAAPGIEWSHEERSVKMVQHIVDEHNICIEESDLQRVKDLILGSCKPPDPQRYGEKRFLFDIVANGRNGIDVDKFDYIQRDSRACAVNSQFDPARLLDFMRVIDNEICYQFKTKDSVCALFEARAELHKIVYTHKAVKGLELMVADALLLANSHLRLVERIQDPSEFWKLDDTILRAIEVSNDPALRQAQALVRRIKRRELYKFCKEFIVPNDQLEHFKDVTPQDIICSQLDGRSLQEEDVGISNVKIDLTRGKEHPVDRVHFFENFRSTDKFTSPMDKGCFPCQQKIVRVYSKNPELVQSVSDAFENFQRRTYGQVRSTRR